MRGNQKVLDIARYFIYKNNQTNKGLTNKKLQKLLYYAQAWSLVLRDKELFPDDFEAWIHGPAIPRVYGEYKDFGFEDIKEEIPDQFLEKFSEDEKKLLDQIWESYGKYDGQYLELLSHSEEPWQKARRGIEAYVSSKAVIKKNTMKEFYAQLYEQKEEKLQKSA